MTNDKDDPEEFENLRRKALAKGELDCEGNKRAAT
jgi:hypothetical protein